MIITIQLKVLAYRWLLLQRALAYKLLPLRGFGSLDHPKNLILYYCAANVQKFFEICKFIFNPR